MSESERFEDLIRLARAGDEAAAARLTRAPGGAGPAAEATLAQWLARARHNYQGLLALLDAAADHPVPEPTGAGGRDENISTGCAGTVAPETSASASFCSMTSAMSRETASPGASSTGPRQLS